MKRNIWNSVLQIQHRYIVYVCGLLVCFLFRMWQMFEDALYLSFDSAKEAKTRTFRTTARRQIHFVVNAPQIYDESKHTVYNKQRESKHPINLNINHMAFMLRASHHSECSFSRYQFIWRFAMKVDSVWDSIRWYHWTISSSDGIPHGNCLFLVLSIYKRKGAGAREDTRIHLVDYLCFGSFHFTRTGHTISIEGQPSSPSNRHMHW